MKTGIDIVETLRERYTPCEIREALHDGDTLVRLGLTDQDAIESAYCAVTEMYEVETNRENIGFQRAWFSTEKYAIEYLKNECKWEATISGCVRSPLNSKAGGTVIYIQRGDFHE